MKVLLLAPQPFYTERGTPIAIRLLIQALCDAGHQVDVLTYHVGEPVHISGMRLFRIAEPPGIGNVSIGFSVKKLVCDAWMLVKAFRLMRTGGYDVVHAVEESVFIALAARLSWRFKLVYDMDSLMADQIVEKWPTLAPVLPGMQWFEKEAIKRADLVFAVCPAIQQRACSYIESKRVHLIPDVAPNPSGHAMSDAENIRQYFQSSAPIVMYVGNLEQYQGIDLLLNAVAALEKPDDCNLLIIGGTAEHVRQYQAKVSELGLKNNTVLLGNRPLSALGHYLNQADILCSPRLKGVNTPMKIYAYMLSGKAVLATNIISHSQVLDGNCAYLVEPTASAMAQGLHALIESAQLRSNLGLAAAELARNHYSEQAFSKRVSVAYQQLEMGNAVH